MRRTNTLRMAYRLDTLSSSTTGDDHAQQCILALEALFCGKHEMVAGPAHGRPRLLSSTPDIRHIRLLPVHSMIGLRTHYSPRSYTWRRMHEAR